MWSMFSELDWAEWIHPIRLDKETLLRVWLWKERLVPSMFLKWNSEFLKTLCVFFTTWPSVDEFDPLREHSNVQWKAYYYSENANILRLPCVSVTWYRLPEWIKPEFGGQIDSSYTAWSKVNGTSLVNSLFKRFIFSFVWFFNIKLS